MDKKMQDVLSKLEKQAESQEENLDVIPHEERMLAITRNIGFFYHILLRAIKAKNILEIGTSYGYSTIWFADAIRKNTDSEQGGIITIENEPGKIQKAKSNFEEAGVSHIIEFRNGDALEILSEMQNDFKEKNFFDFIFIDADKERYIQYFDLCLPLIRKGGIIGADNILIPQRFNPLMKKYLEHVRNNPNVESVTIPIDNGEEITVKI